MTDIGVRAAKAATLILALIALYFGGPALIWGRAGLMWAFMAFIAALPVFMFWCGVFLILYEKMERDDGGDT